jgi:hypothetical protein
MVASSFRNTLVRGSLLAVASIALVAATWSGGEPVQDGPIYEIRDYHIAAESLDDYKEWAESHGVPYLKANLDVVGFWVSAGVDAEVRGAEDDPMGPANVTWIIRYASKAERDEKWPAVVGTPEWGEIFARLPGGGAIYQRVQSRFFTGL